MGLGVRLPLSANLPCPRGFWHQNEQLKAFLGDCGALVRGGLSSGAACPGEELPLPAVTFQNMLLPTDGRNGSRSVGQGKVLGLGEAIRSPIASAGDRHGVGGRSGPLARLLLGDSRKGGVRGTSTCRGLAAMVWLGRAFRGHFGFCGSPSVAAGLAGADRHRWQRGSGRLIATWGGGGGTDGRCLRLGRRTGAWRSLRGEIRRKVCPENRATHRATRSTNGAQSIAH